MFFCNDTVDFEPKDSGHPLIEKTCPEKEASFFSRLTFSWIQPLIRKGFEKALNLKDLWPVNYSDSSKKIVPRFEIYWQRYLENQKTSQRKLQNEEKKFYQTKKVSVLLPLCQLYGRTFLFGVFLRLAADIFSFFNPQILKLLIAFVSSDEPEWKGYLYAFSLLMISVTTTLLKNHSLNQIFNAGFRTRTALVATVYKKSLRLSNSARKQFTLGEIVDLMTLDAQRFMGEKNVMVLLAPLHIALGFYFLWKELGLATLAGFTVATVLVVINCLLAIISKKVQRKQMRCKDRRMKLIDQVLEGMKMIKLCSLEAYFEEKILSIRREEIDALKLKTYINTYVDFIWVSMTYLIGFASFTAHAFLNEGKNLDSQTVFVSITLIAMLKIPFTQLPSSIQQLIEMSVALGRIDSFLSAEEIEPERIQYNISEQYSINIENASFFWDNENDLILKNINLKVKPGEIIGITGPSAAGKSSLLQALMGEMQLHSGTVYTKKSLAYVPQQAFVRNMTLKENILFGKDVDELLYDQVIESCALQQDLETLHARDETVVGEKNLSGGQKQRISLARAAYSDADVFLLDDPLSAVDCLVAKHIFDHLIGPKGILQGKSRIVVTQNISFLTDVDRIIVMNNGEIFEVRTLKGIFSPDEYIPEENRENQQQSTGSLYQPTCRNQRKSIDEKSYRNEKCKDDLIESENIELASVKWRTYFDYLESANYFLVVMIILTNTAAYGIAFYLNTWLTKWTKDSSTENHASKRNYYIGIYAFLTFMECLSVLLMFFFVARAQINASKILFRMSLKRVLRSKMSFFYTNPVGRILNRFGTDIDIIDNFLPEYLSNWKATIIMVVSTIAVVVAEIPICLLCIIPTIFIYSYVFYVFLPTARQLKRLESVSKSPMYTHFEETITGLNIIRAFRVENKFYQTSESLVDVNQTCCYLDRNANRWLSIRLEFLGSLLIFSSGIFAVISRKSISGSIVGLAVSYSLRITDRLDKIVSYTSEIATNIVAVERNQEYCKLPQETSFIIEETPKNWPSKGQVEFRDIQVRYKKELNPTLNGLNFVVRGGEKIGICGRTGSGKSTFFLALLRILEPSHGKILIDNLDIAKIELENLRSKITIVPQDLMLFSSSIRSNLDPMNCYSDEEIWNILKIIDLKVFVESLPDCLSHQLFENGEILSVGRRQLMCLARALLKKSKIVIFDEPFASADSTTETIIRKTIKEQFKDSTVFIITHQLGGIIDADRVMVLNAGRISEFDSPVKLLENKNSLFYKMLENKKIEK